jgi:hypothetical protein
MSLLHSSADSSWCAISAALNCKCTYKNIKIFVLMFWYLFWHSSVYILIYILILWYLC